jgi:hypothetical protein
MQHGNVLTWLIDKHNIIPLCLQTHFVSNNPTVLKMRCQTPQIVTNFYSPKSGVQSNTKSPFHHPLCKQLNRSCSQAATTTQTIHHSYNTHHPTPHQHTQ